MSKISFRFRLNSYKHLFKVLLLHRIAKKTNLNSKVYPTLIQIVSILIISEMNFVVLYLMI